MLTGTNLRHAKQFNLRVVIEVVRRYGPLARADIARHTALSGQTVSNLVRELLDLGVLRPDERRHEPRRGAPSALVAVNPDCTYAVGLDFGRDQLTGVLVDLAGTVRARSSLELDVPSPAQALDVMADMVGSLVGDVGVGLERVCGVGVGVPGPMFRDGAEGGGYVMNPRSFPGWQKVPLASRLRDRLELPVLLENNATAAALGERWYGEGRQLDSFFFVFLGTGLGGSVVIGGRPHSGWTGNAGEIGYLPPGIPMEPSAAFGAERAHVGQHFLLPALYDRLRAEGITARTPADLDALLAAGVPQLERWMDVAGEHLTGVVLAVECVLDPEAIVYGGRLPERVLRGLVDRVERALPERRIAEKVATPRHLLAAAGADATALGVATLPIYELFAPGPRLQLKRRRPRPGAWLREALPVGGA